MLSVLLFFLRLPRRGHLRRFKGDFFSAQRRQRLPTITTRCTFPTTRNDALLRELARAMPVITRPRVPQSLRPRLPQRRDRPAAYRGRLPATSIKGGNLLRLLPSSAGEGGSDVIPYHYKNSLTCAIVRSIRVVYWAPPGFSGGSPGPFQTSTDLFSRYFARFYPVVSIACFARVGKAFLTQRAGT